MIAVLAWTPSQRPHELAAAFGGVAHTPYLPRLNTPALAPARYAVSALLTAAFLARKRPDAVIVQNPPIVPGIIAYIYSKLTGAKLVMDSHPRGFGLKASRAGRLFRPVHARLMRHAAATMVASEPLADEVRRAGGRPLVVHEPPPLWHIDAPPADGDDEPTVLWVGIFATDEPVAEVVGAARLLPDTRFVLTGDPARCPPDVRAAAPANVTFSGYRRGEDYRALVAAATIMMVLTTAPTSVPRGAFEAVAALRPLVLSDHPLLRTQFPEAVFADNTAAALAAATTQALARRAELNAAAPAVRDRDAARWAAQRDAVLEALR
ncbi:glycosyltransferase [Baekduia sp. Peel2402]|uniref:glycosyltransferase n=1 Tax=Baekduia sp. Peel2402 TaxID=3458296 RepID=UPI00403E7F21